jgi:hypothetical protein
MNLIGVCVFTIQCMDPYDEDKHSKENVQKAAASAYSTSMLLVPIFSEQSRAEQ